ncbi:hypothetical protein [Achromobacter sp. NFACC18-2]|uniref:hypothetical protein n=1 Tax=Achromobacter sp. NFACC18-2 TaxID=1564112 RepID=UPI0008D0A0F3|nr:hypothetical protein [Achromobacter sp. NFACC18-2]SEK12568.1 hypothetical protein SAMN03159494_05673 [Achromobacter sp. NFACC18-2]
MVRNTQIASHDEFQIVEAFSSAIVPEQIIRDSNIKDLIRDMGAAQASVKSDSSRLERARSEQKEGNALTNWWKDRGDAVQDAQIDLNRSIGNLTEKSSQLLIVNTAISKVLHDQQGLLMQQQGQLRQQAGAIEEQNRQILDQQNVLEQQQRDINAANNGLMEAKGISQEQAQKLVGCVTLVTEAEQRIDAANRSLMQNVERYVQESGTECLARMEEFNLELGATLQRNIQSFDVKIDEQQSTLQKYGDDLTSRALSIEKTLDQRFHATGQDLEQRLDASKQQFERTQLTHHEAVAVEMGAMSESLSSAMDSIRTVEAQVLRLELALKHSRRSQFLATIAAIAIAGAALAWQAVQVGLA